MCLTIICWLREKSVIVLLFKGFLDVIDGKTLFSIEPTLLNYPFNVNTQGTGLLPRKFHSQQTLAASVLQFKKLTVFFSP